MNPPECRGRAEQTGRTARNLNPNFAYQAGSGFYYLCALNLLPSRR